MQTADLIAEYLDAAAEGRVRAPGGRPYGRDELRTLRGALSHVAYDELGTWDVADLGDREIQALISRLRAAGVPRARVDAVEPALRALYGYAIQERLVQRSPVAAAAPRADDPPPAPAATPARTPTMAVLAVTEHALTWTVRMIVAASLLVVLALLIALA